MSSVDTSGLKALGTATQYQYAGADPTLLEFFDNPFNKPEFSVGAKPGLVHIEAPEFTSLCPLTGQPDFATIVIEYRPRRRCVESKSLKLYLGSFRQAGEFHEACVARIGSDLVKLLDPLELVVEGRFTPRGGIPFWPRFEYVESEFSNWHVPNITVPPLPKLEDGEDQGG